MPPRAQKLTKELRRPTFIKAWRKERGLTLEGLVEALDHRVGYIISDGQLSRIERGISPYTQDVLEAIAAVLQVDRATLLSGPPKAPDEDEAITLIGSMKPAERQRAVAMLRLLKTGSDDQ